MASILDRISQLGTAGAQPQQKGIEELLRQKSGKAQARVGAGASALGEKAGILAGTEAIREQTFAERLADVQSRGKETALAEQQALQEQELRQQQDLSQERLAAEAAVAREGIRSSTEEAALKGAATKERQIKVINNEAEKRLRDLASSRNIALDDIFSQYEFDAADLEDREDAAQLEQQAFLLAIQDKKYLSELERIGQERQLSNSIEFDNEIQRIVMEENLNGLLKEINFKTGRAAQQRDFQKQLADIDIEAAISISRATIRDENIRTQWETAGTVTTTIAKSALAKEKE